MQNLPEDNPKDTPTPTPTTVEAAQLQKLQMEIAALNRAERFEAEAEQQKRDKLFYETQSLRWQTSLFYKLTQFATIITIFATAFGVYQAYTKLVEDKIKATQEEEKARRERINALYRSDLQQLLQYPIDKEHQTIPIAVFLMHDLADVVNTGFKDDPETQARMKDEIGLLIAQLVKSPEFNLTETRNTDFERKALEHCKFYENYLINHPSDNRDILSKYKGVLLALHKTNPDYYEKFEVDPEDPTAFIEGQESVDQTRFFQYAYLFHAYRKHVSLLDNSYALKSDPEVINYKTISFCWFWLATRNRSLLKSIFGGTAEQVEAKSKLCEPPPEQPERPTRPSALNRSTRN